MEVCIIMLEGQVEECYVAMQVGLCRSKNKMYEELIQRPWLQVNRALL